MIIKIPREPSFDCPSGTFSAVLIRVGPGKKSKQGENTVRLVFGVGPDSDGGYEFHVAHNFKPDMAKGGELRSLLKSWGQDLTKQEMDGGEVNLHTRIGHPATIETEHVWTENYAKPFVKLVGVLPPVNLVTAPPVIVTSTAPSPAAPRPIMGTSPSIGRPASPGNAS